MSALYACARGTVAIGITARVGPCELVLEKAREFPSQKPVLVRQGQLSRRDGGRMNRVNHVAAGGPNGHRQNTEQKETTRIDWVTQAVYE